MKHMTAVVTLAAVGIAAPVEVEKRDDECPDTATAACCPYPVGLGDSVVCEVLQPGQECLAIVYCCPNKGDGGIINVSLDDCEQIL
ncbi:hypothetical protein H634G_02662 [Metarhizium anisopliae BRIP 53293]|uniref:Hydrophobin n=1 Tax=Metarhizium anisopliae BRIP 53293 TaxID=1291518 RepID=A0A0D9P5B9_METAN|nr:hypothetical protein H634G_02662 [Metarhizium anisopliae BRIP 53293]KJK89015.1 hypothetical protein H633G_07123 [Metarhizium anisopliae BRIP 53284]